MRPSVYLERHPANEMSSDLFRTAISQNFFPCKHVWRCDTCIDSPLVADRTTSPQAIGDKPKYYFDDLISLPFSVFESSSPLGEAMLELKAKDPLQDMSPSRSMSSSSMSSVSSLYQIHTGWQRFGSNCSDTMFPAEVTALMTTAVDRKRLLTDASSDQEGGDFDDAFVDEGAIPTGHFERRESHTFSEKGGSVSSSLMSPVVKCFPRFGVNPAILRLTHVDMPSVSTDPYSEVDASSLEFEKWERRAETPTMTDEAVASQDEKHRMPDIRMPVFTDDDYNTNGLEPVVIKSEFDEKKSEDQKASQTHVSLNHSEADSEMPVTHQHPGRLGVNCAENRLPSDPGPPPNSPLRYLEEPEMNGRLRAYSDPQFIHESADSDRDEFPSPPTHKNVMMESSFDELPQMRSQSLDDVSALETTDCIEKRRKSDTTNPIIKVTDDTHTPIGIQPNWSNVRTSNGDRQLLSYHVIRRTASMSPELTEIDGHDKSRRFSSGSSSGSFRAEKFIVQALSRKYTRTIKRRWRSAYGTDTMPQMPRRRSSHALGLCVLLRFVVEC